MNKFLVVAANGKAGQKIVNELIARDLDVTVAVRQANKTQASQEGSFQVVYGQGQHSQIEPYLGHKQASHAQL